MEKTAELDDLDIRAEMVICMKTGLITLNIPIYVDILGTGMTGDHPKTHIHVEASALGLLQYQSDMYRDGDVCYTVTDGEMTESSAEDIEAVYGVFSDADALMAFLPEEVLENAALSADGEGNRTVSLTVADEILDRYYGEMLRNAIFSAVQDSPLESVSFSHAKLEMVVGTHGYIDSYRISFDLTVTASDSVMNGTAELMIRYQNHGKPVSVDIPIG